MSKRLVVVGGGVIGTAVAVAAVDRGHEVVQLERDEEPRGASVRNFGLIWICGRAGGRELELALDGRRRWEALARRAPGIGFRPTGCVLAASNEAELAVVAAACEREDAAERGFKLLSRAEMLGLDDRLAGTTGGLRSPLDAVVEPAAALAALRALASASGRYRFVPGCTVVDVNGAATDHRGRRHEADLVILSPGDALELVPDEVVVDAGLGRRNLQMLDTRPLERPLRTAVADGDALRYYPAFDLPERKALPPPAPVVDRLAVQLLIAPRADRSLTVGDTHVDDRPGAFGSDEEADEHLLRRGSELLAGLPLRVRRRWTGSYLRRTDGRDCVLVESLESGALLVGAAGGMGVTAAHAIAAQALDGAGL